MYVSFYKHKAYTNLLLPAMLQIFILLSHRIMHESVKRNNWQSAELVMNFNQDVA